MARYTLPFSKSVKSTVMTTEIFDMFKILTLKQEKFSQSDPFLIRSKLASVLIRAYLCLTGIAVTDRSDTD